MRSMSNYISWIRSKVGNDPIILVAALAILRDEHGRVLLQKTSDKHAYSWGLPGGMLELGEGAEDALKREIKEETGLIVEVDYFLGTYTKRPITEYKNGDRAHVICLVFVCHKIEGTLEADGHESIELEFFEPVQSQNLLSRNSQIIEDYLSGARGLIK